MTQEVIPNVLQEPVSVDDNGGSLTIDAVSLPLPTGAATAANQLPDGHNVTVDNGVGAAAVPIQDGGNSITVDGTVAATQSGGWNVGINAGTNNIGDVDVLTVPAPLSTTGGGTEATALRVTIANDSTGIVSVDDNGASLTVDGTVAATQSGGWNVGINAGTNNIGDVDVLSVPAPLSTTGGGTEATALRVTIANDSTGVVSVDDNGGSLTVDGTVAVSSIAAGTNYIGKTRLTDGVTDAEVVPLTGYNAQAVAIVDGSGNQITSFGGGTQYTEDAAAAADPVGTVPILVRQDTPASNVSTDGDNVAQRGTTYGAAYVTLLDTGGNPVSVGGGTQYTEDVAAAADPIGTMGMAVRADTLAAVTSTNGDNIALRATNNGELYVKQTDSVPVTDNGGSLTIDAASLPLPTGAATAANQLPDGHNVTIDNAAGAAAVNIQDGGNSITVDGTVTANLAAGTNNIGDVDILSIAAGDNNIGNVDIVTMPNVTLAAGTNTNEVVGDVAHSAGVAGNPVLICGVSQAVDDTAPPNRVDAESDATRLATDFDGAVFVRPHGPQSWSYHLDTSTAQTDATVHAAPGTGLSLYVGTIVFSSGSATAINLFFEEGASKVLGPFYLEAVAGRGMAISFNPPKKITANTALTLTTSASIAHSVDVTGFTAQG